MTFVECVRGRCPVRNGCMLRGPLMETGHMLEKQITDHQSLTVQELQIIQDTLQLVIQTEGYQTIDQDELNDRQQTIQELAQHILDIHDGTVPNPGPQQLVPRSIELRFKTNPLLENETFLPVIEAVCHYGDHDWQNIVSPIAEIRK